MVNFLLNLLIILFVYVIVYILYYAVCVFNSTKAKKFLIKQKYNAASKPNNMILIILQLSWQGIKILLKKQNRLELLIKRMWK